MNSLYANPNKTKGKVKQPPILKGVVGKPANGSNSGPIRTPNQGGGDRYPGPSGGIRQATPVGGDPSQPMPQGPGGGFKPSPQQLQQIYDAAKTGGPQAAQAMIAQTHGPAAANAVSSAAQQLPGGVQSYGGQFSGPSGGIRAVPTGPAVQGPGSPQALPQVSNLAMPQGSGVPGGPPQVPGGIQAAGMPAGGVLPGAPGGQDLQEMLRQRLLAARMPQQAPNVAVQPGPRAALPQGQRPINSY